LQDLGYFGDVKVTPTPGSAPDRTIIDTEVAEKATGELSLGGGYSTTSGILGQAGLREHNLVGSGIDAGLNGTLGAYESQVDLSATDPYFLDRNWLPAGTYSILTTTILTSRTTPKPALASAPASALPTTTMSARR